MEPVDFVLTWVDGSDPAWQEEKRATLGLPKESDDGLNARYRDWDNLRYWFRGVEAFAPWVRRIHFVTWGHLPAWLDTSHEKINVVRHEDYIPARYLPTFSSRAIDLNLHRIADLSDQFVLFDDDMFLIRPCRPRDFFRRGKPRSMGVLSPATVSAESWFYAPVNDAAIINKHFNMYHWIREHPLKWFNPRYGSKLLMTMTVLPYPHCRGFFEPHFPQMFLKSTFEDVWRAEPELLDETCRSKVRQSSDVNIWLVRYWQLATGNFAPMSPKFGRLFQFGDGREEMLAQAERYISQQKGALVCLNDNVVLADDFEVCKARVNAALDALLPTPSSFER